MNRRDFIKAAGFAVAGTALTGAPTVRAETKYEWKMVTCWPKNLPGIGTGAVRLARIIERMSGGRIAIEVYGAGELVAPFEAFDAVAEGKAQIGHGTSYYWKDKHEAFSFFSTIPFGLNAHEMITWLQFGGGQELMDELYAQYNLKAFPAGNTGTQMGGWYNKEIRSANDLNGLKIRMPGLGGEVFARLGAQVINLQGGEILQALKSGDIDAADWVGPFNDLQLGLYKAAKYYYWPGWQEPGPMTDCFVNRKIYESLPDDLQEIIRQASYAIYNNIWSEYSANNGASLVELIKKHNVQLKRFPERLLAKLAKVSQEVVEEFSAKDPFSKKVYNSYNAFRRQAIGWTQIGEEAFSLARSLSHTYLE
jgi:TRAP-type mannitol/chloroaromatic compound transport system substrate-binding protein